MSYVDEVLAKVREKNASEPEFLQAVDEVLNSLRPVIEANEEMYRLTVVSVYSSTMLSDPTREVFAFIRQ